MRDTSNNAARVELMKAAERGIRVFLDAHKLTRGWRGAKSDLCTDDPRAIQVLCEVEGFSVQFEITIREVFG